jgi:hypothetical protein
MAPRKKKKSEEAQTPRNVLKVKDAGVKRRTRSSGLPPEYTGLEQLPKARKVEVQRLKNGLVDLTETPKHLLKRYICLLLWMHKLTKVVGLSAMLSNRLSYAYPLKFGPSSGLWLYKLISSTWNLRVGVLPRQAML